MVECCLRYDHCPGRLVFGVVLGGGFGGGCEFIVCYFFTILSRFPRAVNQGFLLDIY